MWSEARALHSMPSTVDSTASCPACLCLSKVLSRVLSSPHFHFLLTLHLILMVNCRWDFEVPKAYSNSLLNPDEQSNVSTASCTPKILSSISSKSLKFVSLIFFFLGGWFGTKNFTGNSRWDPPSAPCKHPQRGTWSSAYLVLSHCLPSQPQPVGTGFCAPFLAQAHLFVPWAVWTPGL